MAEVRLFTSSDTAAWDNYVHGQPQATVFHRLAWAEAVADAYGHTPRHVTAWQGDHLVGVLPLMEVRSVFVGKVLVSLPYATYGGVCADDASTAEALADFAEELCRERGANYVEYRHRDPVALDRPTFGHYDTFRKALPESAGDIVPGLPRKTRAAVRKGLKELGDDAARIGPEYLDTVYDLYSITLRRLGSPNYRRRLFRALQDRYGDDCVFLAVFDQGQPVAGVMSFVFGDEIVPYFSGSVAGGMAKRANNLMYVKLMAYAVERGLRMFDFGRTRRDNRGPYDFKRHMGFEPTPLAYQIHLAPGAEMPNLSPSNARFSLAIRLWRRLPLWLTRAAGGRISKWIP